MNQRTRLDWSNNEAPPISASNLDGIVADLNACATVLNKYDSMKQITAETVANYPDSHYKINKANVSAVSSAINAKGVHCSKLFKNIPSEILAIPEEGYTPQKGYIKCDNIPNIILIETECDTYDIVDTPSEKTNVLQWHEKERMQIHPEAVSIIPSSVYSLEEPIPDTDPIEYRVTEHGYDAGYDDVSVFGSLEYQTFYSYKLVNEYSQANPRTPYHTVLTNEYKDDYLHGFKHTFAELSSHEILRDVMNGQIVATDYSVPIEAGTEMSDTEWLSCLADYTSSNGFKCKVNEGYIVRVYSHDINGTDTLIGEWLSGDYIVNDVTIHSLYWRFVRLIRMNENPRMGCYVEWAKLDGTY